jgi:hypothetical protein
MEETSPEWATRHHYYHHSNYKGKSKAKIFFDKCHVRPAIKLAESIVDNPDATDGQKQDAWDVIQKLDQKYNGGDNAAMLMGRLTQMACDAILIEHEDVNKAIDDVLFMAHNYEPRTWDGGVDKMKRDYLLTELPFVIKNAVVGLQEAMSVDNKILGEITLFDKLPGNRLPYMTKPDYGRRGDLKTKWSKINPKTKSGFSTHSLPTNLGKSIWDMKNVSQAAGFWALNSQLPPFLLYANKTDYRLFNEGNCHELEEEHLHFCMKQSVDMNKAIELKLQKSETKQQLLEDEYPDTHDWLEPPSIILEAELLWSRFYAS